MHARTHCMHTLPALCVSFVFNQNANGTDMIVALVDKRRMIASQIRAARDGERLIPQFNYF